ncbi:MAG: lantibiotic dehydratase [Holophagales bacterium]|nr:lantibiotic dehydratase [Holophagales bacterium]
MSAAGPAFFPSGAFHLRTPLLPFETLAAFGAGLGAAGALDDPQRLEEALAADRERQRRWLRELVERPEIREALFVASPDLDDALPAWLDDPDGERGQRVERALVRYLSRAAGRSTPFGLFAGASVGRIGGATRLVLEGREAGGRHSRLDMDYLFALVDALMRDPARRAEFVLTPNSSLYGRAEGFRYVESRLKGEDRTYHLVALEDSPALRETLARAAGGARAADLAAALVEPDVSIEEAAEYVGHLVEAQILVPDLGMTVTGPEPTASLAARLAEGAATVAIAQELARAESALEALDAGGTGAPPARYRAIAEGLATLPSKPELKRLFQVDLVKASPRATLGGPVLREIERGVEVVRRLFPAPRADELSAFRDAFRERWEEREVPLVEALDDEWGLGYPPHVEDASGASPLLRDLEFPSKDVESVAWGKREKELLRMLARALADGAGEIVLGPRDVEALSSRAPLPLPGAFAVMARVAARSDEALDAGDVRVLLQGVVGPSGATLLGRFCHADPDLRRVVEDHVRAEEALEPDALFAEIVHLPEGRIGNILIRPVLREYEIPFLGGSGVAAERRIPVTDLLVSVKGERLELRSERLGRRVIPRLTSAHAFSRRSLGLYRFLCALQGDGLATGPAWSWGPLDGAPFLPRVSHGRLVLSRAAWNVTKEELTKLGAAKGAERFRAVAEWRRARALPRHVVLADDDNELPVDLESVLSVEGFVHLVKGRDEARLEELFPPADELCAYGPEGRFVHELVVPFVRVPESQRPAAPPPSPVGVAATAPGFARIFPPGSEWLYAKLYGGTTTADRLLVEGIGPLARAALASGAADRWFFIRYADPRDHLRVRFHGEPRRLHGEVLPALEAAAAAHLGSGLVWKVQLDTYEREVERYGGPEGMLLAERLFQVDSEAVLDLLERLEEGDAGAEERWRLAVAGADALLADLGFDLAGRKELLREVRQGYGVEHREDAALRRSLGERYRKESSGLLDLLAATDLDAHPLGPGLEVLRRRSERLSPIVGELGELERTGRLTTTRASLARNTIHMFADRLFRTSLRRQELVLYDLLSRLSEARAARLR